MKALLHAELLKLRTTRTFVAVVGTAAALSLILVALGASLDVGEDPHALFTNNSITYIIVLLGAIGMTGEWRHRTITGSVLAAPDRLRLLAAKAISYSVAGVVLSLLVTVATMLVGTLILSGRGEATLGAGDLADVLWRNLVVAALLGPLGVAFGALIRNQIVTVVGLIAHGRGARAGRLRASLPASAASARWPGRPVACSAASTPARCWRPALAVAVLIAWAGLVVHGRRAAPRPPRPRLNTPTPKALLLHAFTLRTLSALLLGGLAFAGAAQADTPCPDGVRCGTVTVPLDRANPAAGTIDVAYGLVPRTDTSRPALGTIVPNPGGPGQSTTASAGLYVDALAPLRQRRDLLLIDPRGTGQSGALACPGPGRAGPARARLRGADHGRAPPTRAGASTARATSPTTSTPSARRWALGKLDLWGDSYGTFLMPVYAARHPEHVRSIVLDGAFPIAFDLWGRDVLRGVRRVIRVTSGPRTLDRIGRLARRLRKHPVRFSAQGHELRLGENELANVTYGGGDPTVYKQLPAAVDAALRRDYAPLQRLVAADKLRALGYLSFDPTQISFAGQAATTCHDYPRPFSLADTPARRRADYERALAKIDPSEFAPFSAERLAEHGHRGGTEVPRRTRRPDRGLAATGPADAGRAGARAVR